MSIEENTRIAAEFVKVCNEQDWDRFAKFFENEKFGTDYATFEKSQWIPAFPDTNMEIVSLTAQDDRVVIQSIVRMTHTGELKFSQNFKQYLT